jgi:hypothetical protein
VTREIKISQEKSRHVFEHHDNLGHSTSQGENSSIGIATKPTAGTTGVRDFPLVHSVHTESGTHPSSFPMGTGGCFHRGKAAEV